MPYEWKQHDYVNLDWPKSYVVNAFRRNEETYEINSLSEYMKRTRAQHPDRVS
ncbi:unnamed protein product, partial [marine sediment metagenome]